MSNLYFTYGTTKSGKTLIASIHSAHTKEYLGAIYYHPPWRKYIFESDKDIIWSTDCLKEVQNEMDTLNRKHKVKEIKSFAEKPKEAQKR